MWILNKADIVKIKKIQIQIQHRKWNKGETDKRRGEASTQLIETESTNLSRVSRQTSDDNDDV